MLFHDWTLSGNKSSGRIRERIASSRLSNSSWADPSYSGSTIGASFASSLKRRRLIVFIR